GEYRLLDLPGVSGAGDEHQLLREVDDDGRLGVGAVHLGNAVEIRGYHQGEICVAEVLKLLGGGADQELVDEQILAGQLVDDAELSGIFLICAGKSVEHEQILLLQV